MLRVSKQIEYGLMVLSLLKNSSPNYAFSAKQVALSTGAPFDAVARVMKKLCKDKVLSSSQGVNGGYSLNIELKDLSFKQLTEIIDGPFALTKCLQAKSDCQLSENCNIVSPVTKLQQRFLEFYSSLYMDELLESAQKKSPNDWQEKIKMAAELL